MKATLNFGKVAYMSEKKNNPVDVTIELRSCGGQETFTIDPVSREKTITGKTPEYIELSICGNIWNHLHTDIYCGGQCLDTIAKYIHTPEFKEIYKLWKRYHLNGMHAGTPEQEAAIKEWEAEGNRYEYTAVCDMLKARGLYEVNFTGLTTGRRYNNEPYKYGHGWIIEELPGEVITRVEHIINAANAH